MANQVTLEEFQKSINQPDSIKAALESEGITPSYLAKLLKKELHAKEVKVFAFQGHIEDKIELEALDIQQKARQDAHKLMDHYPTERHQVEGSITIEVTNFSSKGTMKESKTQDVVGKEKE